MNTEQMNLRYESKSHITVNLNVSDPARVLNEIQGFPDWRSSWKKWTLVSKASVVADEQMVNWEEGEISKVAYIACTWLGRVALVSAASRAKSTTLSSEPQRASPIPLSITLNPDERMSWWARRNRLANSRMMVKLCKTFDMTDFFTLCSPFDFQHLTVKHEPTACVHRCSNLFSFLYFR